MSMFGVENLVVFVTTGILLNIFPGPDTLYIIGRSLGQGRGAGIAAALGIGSGGMVHTLLGAFGLSAILATSAQAFALLKFAGCGYLLYQGGMLLYNVPRELVLSQPEIRSAGLMRIYRQGALTNILNPKVAVFFLAFLPQFISASSSSKPLSFLILGMVFIITGTIWCLIVAVFASFLSSRLRDSSVVSKRLQKVTGILFILIGLKLATAKINP